MEHYIIQKSTPFQDILIIKDNIKIVFALSEQLVGWLVGWFYYDISTFVGYLTQNLSL